MINPSIKYPDSLVKFLQKEEQQILSKLLNQKSLETVDLEKELSHILQPLGGIFSKRLSYSEILDKLLEKKNIQTSADTIHNKEESLLLHRFKSFVKNLSADERRKLESEIKKFSAEKGVSSDQALSLNALSGLTAANLSGFGLYIMASTVVGGLTSIFGITLSFAFYTGMSSVLSFVTGPVGWAVGLGYMAYTFRNDNLESATAKISGQAKQIKNKLTGSVDHTLLIVCFIASSRIVLKEENEKRRSSLERQKQELVKNMNKCKSEIRDLKITISNCEKKILKNEAAVSSLDEQCYEIDVQLGKIKNFENQTQP